MNEIADRYRRLANAFATTIDAVPTDRWASPSPCDEWTARDVVQHVVDTQGLFLGFIGEILPDGPAVADDPVDAFRNATDATQSALDDPARATRRYQGFTGESTFEAGVDRFLVVDLITHRWDLARSTGGDETIAPEDAQRVIDAIESFGDTARSPGAFGPAVTVEPDADLTTRMVALAGRRP